MMMRRSENEELEELKAKAAELEAASLALDVRLAKAQREEARQMRRVAELELECAILRAVRFIHDHHQNNHNNM
jgi:hypothetical protein